MTKRSTSILLVAISLMLLATFDLMAASEVATVTWLLAAAGLLTVIVCTLPWNVLRPLWAGAGFHDVESLFWIAFLALPTFAWLMYAVFWNLLDWLQS